MYPPTVALQSLTPDHPQSPSELSTKYRIPHSPSTKVHSRLRDSSSYIYTCISLPDVFYEAASRSYSDALEQSGVATLLTSSNSIDSWLDIITALLSFTTGLWTSVYVYSVPSSHFESKVDIDGLPVFAVWVGFRYQCCG